MTRMRFITGLTLALAITVAAGALHGRLSGRWGASREAERAALQILSLPDQVGPWRLEETLTLGQAEQDQLQPYGYLNRRYVHLDTGRRVTVFLLAGPVGPTAVHNPEICFSSRNFQLVEKEPVTLRVEGHRTDQFWATTFRANDVDQSWLRVYYAWSDGTNWQATDDGRFNFAGLPYLYKLQLATPSSSNTEPDETEPCRMFLSEFLPVIRTLMVPAKVLPERG